MKDDLFSRLLASQGPVLSCVKDENHYLPAGYEVAHNTGRWWEAALILKETTGMEIPSRTYKAMLINFHALTGNPYGLLLNDVEVVGGGTLNYHNLRESLLACATLIEYTDSKHAKRCAETLFDTIDRRFFKKTLSDAEICEKLGVVISTDTMLVRPDDDVYREDDYTSTTGRAIEGMYRYWKATNSPLALEIMKKTVSFHKEHSVCADGSAPAWLVDTYHTGHNHSYLGTLRGLLLYALEFGDGELIESIYLTYKKTIPAYCVDNTGYAPHDLGLLRFPDEWGDPVGDHGSCIDKAYIAYLLATCAGYDELLDDVEEMIRGRIFYSQMTDEENYGAWGTFCGYFGANAVIDVYCLIAATLCRVYKSFITEKEDGIYVSLHFSGDCAAATVVAERSDVQITRITPHVAKPLYIRIPAWCDGSSIRVSVEDGDVEYLRKGVWLVVNGVNAGKTVEISFDLPTRESFGKTWVSDQHYKLCWKGDTLVSTERIK